MTTHNENVLLMGHRHGKEREDNDFYPTPPFVTYALLKSVEAPKRIWEPACGRGWMSKELIRCGHDVVSSDLFEYDDPFVEAEYGIDFLNSTKDVDGVITNPPYEKNLAEKFMLHSIQMVDFTAMLARVLFLESMRRHNNLFMPFPPSDVLVFSGRFSCYEPLINDPLGGTVAYAWYVWDKRQKRTNTNLKWIDSNKMYKDWMSETSASLSTFLE